MQVKLKHVCIRFDGMVVIIPDVISLDAKDGLVSIKRPAHRKLRKFTLSDVEEVTLPYRQEIPIGIKE